jgi:hypothetical protein
MYICEHICAYAFIPNAGVICIRFSAYPNYIHIQMFVKTTCRLFKERKIKQHRQGLMLGLAYLMPDCWLEVNLHPEGTATGLLDQGFPWLSMIPEQILSWYPKSSTACFTCSPPKGR